MAAKALNPLPFFPVPLIKKSWLCLSPTYYTEKKVSFFLEKKVLGVKKVYTPPAGFPNWTSSLKPLAW